MKRMMTALAIAGMMGAAFAGAEYPELPERIGTETKAEHDARLAWWQHDRFGMFIHFGLYSMAARHEWVKKIEGIEDGEYDRKYFRNFNPDLADPREWAKAAKRAGMKYIVMTTKHHEGFCLWDTKTVDYKITNTPYGEDFVKKYVEACRAEGLKVGFYFSLMDWHHPGYSLDQCHPWVHRMYKGGMKDKEVEAEALRLNKNRDMKKFREDMFAQVKELLTNYGKIDIIWYDFTPKGGKIGKSYKDWNAVELVKLTRKLQPGIIIDNRLDLMDTEDGWDFVTPEQFKVQVAPSVRGKEVPWETCQTFSGSWGYHRDENTWKSPKQLIELLAHSVSFGGNLIMNVGPTGRGTFDARALDRLDGFAKWMAVNGRSIYGCGRAPKEFTPPAGTTLTYNGKTNRLYIHLNDYPMGFLPCAFIDKIEYAQFLHDGSEIKFWPPPERPAQDGEQLGELGGIELPVVKPAVEVPVIEIVLKK